MGWKKNLVRLSIEKTYIFCHIDCMWIQRYQRRGCGRTCRRRQDNAIHLGAHPAVENRTSYYNEKLLMKNKKKLKLKENVFTSICRQEMWYVDGHLSQQIRFPPSAQTTQASSYLSETSSLGSIKWYPCSSGMPCWFQASAWHVKSESPVSEIKIRWYGLLGSSPAWSWNSETVMTVLQQEHQMPSPVSTPWRICSSASFLYTILALFSTTLLSINHDRMVLFWEGDSESTLEELLVE